MTEHTFQLPDGRQLAYACFGPEHGRPVLYFHGTPSSRLEPVFPAVFGVPVQALLQEHNLKIISIDRPGAGRSGFHAKRTLDTFAADVHALAQTIHLSACPLLCWSGGGPYALAMARYYPAVVNHVYIIAGFGSSFSEPEVYDKLGWNKVYFNTARRLPLVLQAALRLAPFIRLKTPIKQKLYDLSNADYAYLKNPSKLDLFLECTTKESCRHGAAGAVQEAQLYFWPFSFSLQQVQTPVDFWWGTEDNVVTYVHAKALEQNLPHVTPHYKPGKGHVSVYIDCLEEILQTIAANY
jgi:pimeloyl-ACP methyl ester carboxylesterase